jgi:hypothetical protein
MRTIKVYSTVGASGEVVTNVGTLRELKPILISKGIDIAGMKLVVGETRNELSIDEAVLPDGDFKLYLMPQKTKSGGFEDTLETIDNTVDRIENDLERVEGKVDAILSLLRNGAGASNSPVKASRSAEDEAAMRDLARLSGGSSEW